MINIAQHIEFVKGQVAFHERQADRYVEDTRRCNLHKDTSEMFRRLAEDLEELEFNLASPSSSSSKCRGARLSLTWEEIEDLPEELMAELSISESNKTEFTIVSIINANGGIASLDQILVALYRKTGEILKRVNMNSRIHRMMQKELIYNVPGKKGVYSTQPIADTEDDTIGIE